MILHSPSARGIPIASSAHGISSVYWFDKMPSELLATGIALAADLVVAPLVLVALVVVDNVDRCVLDPQHLLPLRKGGTRLGAGKRDPRRQHRSRHEVVRALVLAALVAIICVVITPRSWR